MTELLVLSTYSESILLDAILLPLILKVNPVSQYGCNEFVEAWKTWKTEISEKNLEKLNSVLQTAYYWSLH